jgi:hypothetical protein
MIENVRADDPRLVVIRESLAPYAWQRLSTEMLARRLIAAHDRNWLEQELTAVYGMPDERDAVEPASRDDERLWIVARALHECGWRSLTLCAVCRHALAALDSWRRQRQWLEIELAWTLESGDT